MLRDSHLIRGHDYTLNERLNSLLADPNRHCVMLYPGRLSRNLSLLTPTERSALVPEGRRLTVVVIDGTWSTARKTVHLSRNLRALPRIGFVPPAPSRFRVRQQPRPECVSTIEAIHQTIELMGAKNRDHDRLLEIFDKMVNRQIELSEGRESRRRRAKLGLGLAQIVRDLN